MDEIPAHFPFVKLGAFVVMPNHVHGIIIINKTGDADTNNDNDANITNETDNGNVETQNFASLPSTLSTTSSSILSSALPTDKPKNKFGPQSQNLASIIRGYKIGVTKNACKIHSDFTWQPRFYDRIIRNDKSYYTIAEYIRTNPVNWNEDKFQ